MSKKGRTIKKQMQEVEKSTAFLEKINRDLGLPGESLGQHPPAEGGSQGDDNKEVPPGNAQEKPPSINLPETEAVTTPPSTHLPEWVQTLGFWRVKVDSFSRFINVIWNGMGRLESAYRSASEMSLDIFQGYGEMFVLFREDDIAFLIVDRISLKYRTARLQLFDVSGMGPQGEEFCRGWEHQVGKALDGLPQVNAVKYEYEESSVAEATVEAEAEEAQA